MSLFAIRDAPRAARPGTPTASSPLARIALSALLILGTMAGGARAAVESGESVACCTTTVSDAGVRSTFCHLFVEEICWSLAGGQFDARVVNATNAECLAEYNDCTDNGAIDSHDMDGDGVSDLCDCAPTIPNADQLDRDSDGICDVLDNCPDTYNPDQADVDTDGVGDACDNCPNTPNADQADGDTEGVGDVCDNCPNTANADQNDADLDGIGDICDPCTIDGQVNGFEVCDPLAPDEGVCCTQQCVLFAPGTPCNGTQLSANECEMPVCTAEGECVGAPVLDGTVCDDHDLCTMNATCWGGLCRGAPKPCLPADQCSDCTCDPATGAMTQLPTPGVECVPDDPCTIDGVCQADGACAGQRNKTCSATSACRVGVCDQTAGGTCTEEPANEGGACDDWNSCTVGDRCEVGVCKPGNETACGDEPAPQCKARVCIPLGDGEHECTLVPDLEQAGAVCDDGDACTAYATCDAHGKCAGGAPIECGESGQCVARGCDSQSGCTEEIQEGAECVVVLEPSGVECPAGVCAADGNCTLNGLADKDDDGVPDVCDNCPQMPNPGQEDTDGDGQGDACDKCDFDGSPLTITDATGPFPGRVRKTCCGSVDVDVADFENVEGDDGDAFILMMLQPEADDKRVCIEIKDDPRTTGLDTLLLAGVPIGNATKLCGDIGEDLVLSHVLQENRTLPVRFWAHVHCVCCGDKLVRWPEQCDGTGHGFDPETCTDACTFKRFAACSLNGVGSGAGTFAPEDAPVAVDDPRITSYNYGCKDGPVFESSGVVLHDKHFIEAFEGTPIFGGAAAVLRCDPDSIVYFDPDAVPPTECGCPECGDDVVEPPLEACEPALDDNCDADFCLPLCSLTTNNGTACDDGDPCTENDVCDDGGCAGTPKDCSHLDDVCVVGACNTDSGACEAQNRPNGYWCDDEIGCTSDSACHEGECIGGIAVHAVCADEFDADAPENECLLPYCQPRGFSFPADTGCLTKQLGGCVPGKPKPCEHEEENVIHFNPTENEVSEDVCCGSLKSPAEWYNVGTHTLVPKQAVNETCSLCFQLVELGPYANQERLLLRLGGPQASPIPLEQSEIGVWYCAPPETSIVVEQANGHGQGETPFKAHLHCKCTPRPPPPLEPCEPLDNSVIVFDPQTPADAANNAVQSCCSRVEAVDESDDGLQIFEPISQTDSECQMCVQVTSFDVDFLGSLTIFFGRRESDLIVMNADTDLFKWFCGGVTDPLSFVDANGVARPGAIALELDTIISPLFGASFDATLRCLCEPRKAVPCEHDDDLQVPFSSNVCPPDNPLCEFDGEPTTDVCCGSLVAAPLNAPLTIGPLSVQWQQIDPRSLAGQQCSLCVQFIDAGTVSSFQTAWSIDLFLNSQTSTPLEIGDGDVFGDLNPTTANVWVCADAGAPVYLRIENRETASIELTYKAHTHCKCEPEPVPTPAPVDKPEPCTHQEDNAIEFAPFDTVSEAEHAANATCCGSLVADAFATDSADHDWHALEPLAIAGQLCKLCVDFVELARTGDAEFDMRFGGVAGAPIDFGALASGAVFCGDFGERALFRVDDATADGSTLSFKAHVRCECEDTPEPTPAPTPPSGKGPFGPANCSAVCDSVADIACEERATTKLLLTFDELAAGVQDGDLNAALAQYGVAVVSTSPKEVRNPPMVFDSAVPSGNAFELGTPNEACFEDNEGKEGWGHGGRPGRKGENCKPQHRCLILSDDCSSDDPTPVAKGGHMIFEFCAPAYVHSITLINAARGSSIEFFDEFGNRCPSAYKLPYWGKNAKHVANDRNWNKCVDDGDCLAVEEATLYGPHVYPADNETWTLAHCHGEPVSRVTIHMEGPACIDDIQYSLPTLGRKECIPDDCRGACCGIEPICNTTAAECAELAFDFIPGGTEECEADPDGYCLPACCPDNDRSPSIDPQPLALEPLCELCGLLPDAPSLCEQGGVLGACCLSESGSCVDGGSEHRCLSSGGTFFPRHYCRDRGVDRCARGQCCSIEEVAPTTMPPTPTSTPTDPPTPAPTPTPTDPPTPAPTPTPTDPPTPTPTPSPPPTPECGLCSDPSKTCQFMSFPGICTTGTPLGGTCSVTGSSLSCEVHYPSCVIAGAGCECPVDCACDGVSGPEECSDFRP